MIRRFLTFTLVLSVIFTILYFLSGPLLTLAGRWLVLDERPIQSDAVVVLYTGVDYYPRLIQAAELYDQGFVPKIVINGNRKSDVLRRLEAGGFNMCCPWYEDPVRILGILGVPREAVAPISAEDAYDTVSEARAVGRELVHRGFRSVIVTTSKFHTRRAGYIWGKMFEDRLRVCVVVAATDPYDPTGWWKQGKQIRWVLAEYGAWVYYWWKEVMEGN
ncbi:MAG: YdcF family protein [Deltaproteobacteria bacterium]|nr:YdcF family protein [Deltaproteobacteria bacterium]